MNIAIPPHGFYQLQGADIFCELPITPVEAVLGGDIEGTLCIRQILQQRANGFVVNFS